MKKREVLSRCGVAKSTKTGLLALLLCCAITSVSAGSLVDGIVLTVTKYQSQTYGTVYHLSWTDAYANRCPQRYYVYASLDPKVLGTLVAMVRGNQVDLSDNDSDHLWFFQVRRPRNRGD